MSYKGSDYSKESLRDFVDEILGGGGGEFSKLSGSDLAFPELLTVDDLWEKNLIKTRIN